MATIVVDNDAFDVADVAYCVAYGANVQHLE